CRRPVIPDSPKGRESLDGAAGAGNPQSLSRDHLCGKVPVAPPAGGPGGWRGWEGRRAPGPPAPARGRDRGGGGGGAGRGGVCVGLEGGVGGGGEGLGWDWDVETVSRQLCGNQVRFRTRDRLLDGVPDRRVASLFTIAGRDQLDAALAEGKGAILLSSHFGG